MKLGGRVQRCVEGVSSVVFTWFVLHATWLVCVCVVSVCWHAHVCLCVCVDVCAYMCVQMRGRTSVCTCVYMYACVYGVLLLSVWLHTVRGLLWRVLESAE